KGDHIALVYQDHEEKAAHVTYNELNRNANQLARELLEQGLQPDQPVGILMQRTPRMVESILAVWKAGGAYIPIDTRYPLKRIIGILNDSGSKHVISQSQYVGQELTGEYTGKVIALDTCAPRIARKSTENPNLEQDMNGLSYIIFTSGSTGKPKGAMVEHIGMMNHLQAKINDLQLNERSIVVQNATHTFDISVWQFFVALVVAGRTVIYSDETVMDPARLPGLLVRDGVTILEVVPSYLSLMLDTMENTPGNRQDPPRLPMDYLLVTGEEVKPQQIKKWFEKYPRIKVVNAYGPTEASDDITHYIMDTLPGTERIPIGYPLQNLNIYIVDKEMKLCPVGVNGQICVSGVGVGRGYLEDEERTRKVFTWDPFIS
ncbi:MAG: amino acid adenylation domain-containing protein, partial [bacterium]|nr:amino acid adenylation domain-containing protein [bacterium]